MINWRKFNDEKPQDGQECLCIMKHGIIQGTWIDEDKIFETYFFTSISFYARYWAPIEEINQPENL